MHVTKNRWLLFGMALLVSATMPSLLFGAQKSTPESLIHGSAYDVLAHQRQIARVSGGGQYHTEKNLFKGTVAFLLNGTSNPNQNLIHMHIAGGGIGRGGEFISATYPLEVTTSYGEMRYLRQLPDVRDYSWLMRTETAKEEILTLRPMMPLGYILDESITARRPLGETKPFVGKAIGGLPNGGAETMEVKVDLATLDDHHLEVTVAGKTPRNQQSRKYLVWEDSLAERHDIASGSYLAVGGNLGISGRRLASQLELPVTPKAIEVGQIVGVELDDKNLFVGIDPAWALMPLYTSGHNATTGTKTGER